MLIADLHFPGYSSIPAFYTEAAEFFWLFSLLFYSARKTSMVAQPKIEPVCPGLA
jgi:hypothetical protein